MSRKNKPFLRQLRTAILLLILIAVAADTWLQRARTQDWTSREWVAVYPLTADNSPVSATYVSGLTDAAFESIESFMASEATRHGVTATLPVDLQLRHRVYQLPPPPPAGPGPLAAAWWSLKMRYWVWRATRDDREPRTRLRLFLVFHDPALKAELPHSVGLRKLMVGVAHVFADHRHRPMNNVVITHELMHTLGATDKYDPANNQPLFPEGFAEPDREPLYPQRFAEIMGGRVALSAQRAEIPPGLRSTRVGPKTAAEIGWSR